MQATGRRSMCFKADENGFLCNRRHEVIAKAQERKLDRHRCKEEQAGVQATETADEESTAAARSTASVLYAARRWNAWTCCKVRLEVRAKACKRLYSVRGEDGRQVLQILWHCHCIAFYLALDGSLYHRCGRSALLKPCSIFRDWFINVYQVQSVPQRLLHARDVTAIYEEN
jgi:hypothetical protein|mmetsp:Transcript_58179/g.92484  ORF Transcript_58179/g.92484 Transcript_58179/m.92484 type:complete len:172 (+) Transcript_58179:392-907(+)